MLLRLSLTLLVPLAAAVGAQTVRVVAPSPGPGVDFTAVQSAIDASADGDMVVVLPGKYPDSVTVLNKSLVLHGVPDASGKRPEVRDVQVIGIAPIRSVIVRGLSAFPSLAIAPITVRIENCLGPVLIEDCIFDATGSQVAKPVTVKNCGKVVFARSVLRGVQSVLTFPPSFGESGLVITDSVVSAYDCEIEGGYGKSSVWGQPAVSGFGGPGVELISGSLFAAGGSIRGGPGGDGVPEPGGGAGCIAAGGGGPGVLLGGLLRRLDVLIEGGAAGAPLGCAPGLPGVDIVPGGGSIDVIDELHAQLSASSPAEPGAACPLELSGVPGSPVLLLVSLQLGGGFLAGLHGTLLPATPIEGAWLGPVPASGVLAVAPLVPADSLPAGAEGMQLALQAIVPAAAGGGLLSSPSSLLITFDVP
jgi:hypothetical protein